MKIYFSIIIPHRNTQGLLKKCLDSIPDVEYVQVIVVDDGSDNGIELPSPHHSNVEYIYSNAHRSAGYARNIGLEHAVGDWVLFADADDYFNDGFLSELLKNKDSDCDVIFYKVKGVYLASGERAESREYINRHIDKALCGTESSSDVSRHSTTPWGKMIRREIIVKNHLSFDDIYYSNDVMFSAKLYCLSPRIMISEYVLYIVTRHDDSLSGRNSWCDDSFVRRFEVRVRRNLFFLENGAPTFYLLPYIVGTKNVSIRAKMRCICILRKYNHLWYSIESYVVYRIVRRLKGGWGRMRRILPLANRQ